MPTVKRDDVDIHAEITASTDVCPKNWMQRKQKFRYNSRIWAHTFSRKNYFEFMYLMTAKTIIHTHTKAAQALAHALF